MSAALKNEVLSNRGDNKEKTKKQTDEIKRLVDEETKVKGISDIIQKPKQSDKIYLRIIQNINQTNTLISNCKHCEIPKELTTSIASLKQHISIYNEKNPSFTIGPNRTNLPTPPLK